MHAIFFGAKRAHIEAVWRVTRPLLERAECELTPARFDMMRIVHIREYGVMQSTLQWLLGVSAPTISRMLKALEALGMVTRTGDSYDGRCRKVHITARGKACVEKALAATVGVRADQLAVARCGTGDKSRPTHMSDEETTAVIDAAKEKVDVLDYALERMRKALLDRAAFHHPWRVHDTVPPTYLVFVDGRPAPVGWSDGTALDDFSAPHLTPPWREPG